MDKEQKVQVITKYIFISFLLLAGILSILLIVRYNVEGEKHLPFEIEKVALKSYLDTQSNDSQHQWDLSIVQNNDIYIYFKRNKDFDVDVQKIKVNNLRITRNKNIGRTKLFLPTSNEVKNIFDNSTVDYADKGIEYTINNVDNMEKQEIGREGGILAFRISNQNLATYVSNQESEIHYDGTLLEKAGITEKDIKIKATMDIIIEVSKKEKYKGTLTVELPIEDFGEKSIIGKEITDVSNIIFKRCD